METSGPQRCPERSGREAYWVWASPLLHCESPREALPLFVSVQWLAQVALRGLEFALPPKELETPGEPVDTRPPTHPQQIVLALRGLKSPLLVLYLILAAKTLRF